MREILKGVVCLIPLTLLILKNYRMEREQKLFDEIANENLPGKKEK